MTEALVPLFQGTKYQVRVQSIDGDAWMPLIDLSQAWSLDRSTLFKHIERNPDLFTDCTCLIDILSKDGIAEQVRCVNEEGPYLLIARISSGRLKDQAARDAIMHFRMAAPKLIKAYRKQEIVHVAPVVHTIESELQRARTLAEQTGGDLTAFQAIALTKCGLQDYIPALKATPSLVHGEAGHWLNATDIGRECALSAQMVNSWLYNHDFIYPDQGIWRLTARGEAHGEEYPYEATSKQEIRIRWHPSVLVASGLKRPLSENQIALPARV